jgi:hypothetical protein
MEKAPVYDTPILGIRETEDSVKYWSQALKSFDTQKYKDSLINVLNYLNPSIVKERANEDLTEFIIPHGSVKIRFTLENGKYKIIAAFLKLPEKRQNVLLRQLVEINFSTLFLSQIQLKHDELFFYYEAPIELTEPYKMYDIFFEICINADFYDDLFIDELGAKRLIEPEVKSFPKDQMEILWKKYNEYLDEALSFMEYCLSKRMDGIAIEVAVTTLMKLDYYMQPQGYLRSELEKIINETYKRIPLNEIINRLKSDILKLKAFTKEKFEESMYIPNFLISVKKRASIPYVQSIFEKDLQRIKQDIGNSAYLSASTYFMYTIFNLLYRNTVPRQIEEILDKGLKDASAKNWEITAKTLYSCGEQICNIKNKV